VLLSTGLHLIDSLRDRLPDNVDDIKGRVRDTYDTASYRVGPQMLFVAKCGLSIFIVSATGYIKCRIRVKIPVQSDRWPRIPCCDLTTEGAQAAQRILQPLIFFCGTAVVERRFVYSCANRGLCSLDKTSYFRPVSFENRELSRWPRVRVPPLHRLQTWGVRRTRGALPCA
jgi:hypothetical protein